MKLRITVDAGKLQRELNGNKKQHNKEVVIAADTGFHCQRWHFQRALKIPSLLEKGPKKCTSQQYLYSFVSERKERAVSEPSCNSALTNTLTPPICPPVARNPDLHCSWTLRIPITAGLLLYKHSWLFTKTIPIEAIVCLHTMGSREVKRTVVGQPALRRWEKKGIAEETGTVALRQSAGSRPQQQSPAQSYWTANIFFSWLGGTWNCFVLNWRRA